MPGEYPYGILFPVARYMTGGAKLSEQLKNPLDDGAVASQLRTALTESLPAEQGVSQERSSQASILQTSTEQASTEQTRTEQTSTEQTNAVQAKVEKMTVQLEETADQSLFPQQSSEFTFERLRRDHLLTADALGIDREQRTRQDSSPQVEASKTAQRGGAGKGLARSRYGFSGATILDRFANAFLDILRGALKLFARLFGLRVAGTGPNNANQKTAASVRMFRPQSGNRPAKKEAPKRQSPKRQFSSNSAGASDLSAEELELERAKRVGSQSRYFPKRSL